MTANHPFPRQTQRLIGRGVFIARAGGRADRGGAAQWARGLLRKLPDNWACPCCERTVREIVS
jgi:hypothetical protein